MTSSAHINQSSAKTYLLPIYYYQLLIQCLITMSPITATPAPATNAHTLRSSCPPPLCIQPAARQETPKKQCINWTYEMEEAIVKGLVEAVWKGLRADSLYKKEGWQIALNAA